MKEKIVCPKCGNVTERFKNPFPTVDIIVEIQGKILLIKRKNPPDGWAIPGGFIDYGESAEDAARREIKEETGIELTNLEQFHVYSAPDRDPRYHTLTVVLTAKSDDIPKAGDDAAETGLFDKTNLPEPIIFDHPDILKDYFNKKAGLSLVND